MMENVKVKDLQVGHIYVTGEKLVGQAYEGWRATYMYLGRNKSKEFLYLFIGDLSETKNCGEEAIYKLVNLYGGGFGAHDDFSSHKSNKRVFKMQTYNRWNSFELDLNSPLLDPRAKMNIKFYLSM